MKPIRILHVLGKLNIGGAESRIMDLYRVIDRSRVQFDFVVHTDEACFFDEEVRALGGRIFSVPRFTITNLSEYKKAWRNLLNEHLVPYDEDEETKDCYSQKTGDINNKRYTKGAKSEFAMIQGHMTSTASIYLPIAKECGIPITIAHARSAGVDPGLKGKLTRLLRRNLSTKADMLFTCSELASKAVFGENAINTRKITFVPNAIDTAKFRFNTALRDEVRAELDISDRFVFGHVGRVHYAKNHEYLLQIFSDIIKKWPTASKETTVIKTEDISSFEGSNLTPDIFRKPPVLILVGDGPRMAEMKDCANALGVAENVLFLGSRTNVYGYYDAMDMFLYPSRYEGLPGTVVEAQASGLPIIMSNELCDEVIVTDLIETMGIDIPAEKWADRVLGGIKGYICQGNTDMRAEYCTRVHDSGFDVHTQADRLMHFYESGEIDDYC